MTDTEGGAQWELGRAATRMVDALAANDREALRLAMSDHAAALGTQATSSMAAMVQIVLNRMDAHDRRDLDYRAGFRQHLDDRFDAYGRELDIITAEVRAYVGQIPGDERGKLVEMIVDHERRLAALEAAHGDG